MIKYQIVKIEDNSEKPAQVYIAQLNDINTAHGYVDRWNREDHHLKYRYEVREIKT